MDRLIVQFGRLTRWLHYLSGVLLTGLMVMIVANIVGRWLFNAPVQGAVELTEVAMVGIVFMGLAYAEVCDDHIRVDLLYQQLGDRGRAALKLFAALVSFLTVVVLTWRLWDYVGVLKASGRTTSSLRLPLYWVAWVAVAGGAIYAVGVLVTASPRTEPDDGDGEHPVVTDDRDSEHSVMTNDEDGGHPTVTDDDPAGGR
jgi:TRAP-type C4-dicarboxylate transport system permease small subunit